MIKMVICLNLSRYVQRCSVAYLDPRKLAYQISNKHGNFMKQYNKINANVASQ